MRFFIWALRCVQMSVINYDKITAQVSLGMASKVIKSARERALHYVENASRLQKQDLRDNPGARTQGRQLKSSLHNQAGHTIGELQHAAKPPLGWIWGNFYLPWQRLFPGEKYFNGDINLRREYPPLSLIELQRLIDLGWLDTSILIDITALCNTRRYHCKPSLRQFGVQLTDQGADCFSSAVNLEVQWASETAIAAVERAGGRIRLAYYDAAALEAAVDPEKWFLSGKPIPRRKAPPGNLMSLYTDPRHRGYLANPEDLSKAEEELAQIMGYKREPAQENWEEKERDQLFLGIPSGSIISLKDKKCFAPLHPVLRKYYGIDNSAEDNFVTDHSYATTFSLTSMRENDFKHS
uniref:Large ribosomal subunit protein uL15m n=1 Tax=Setaria digitata TaxID=48799 RepID=A0A915Q1A5_9BILA